MRHTYPAPMLVKPAMKALSVKEPWASQIRSGKKTIEFRTWATKYRGPLLICASASPKSDLSGKAVALVDLIDCRPEPGGGWGWVLKLKQRVNPYPVKGKLGLFEAPRP